VRGFGVLRDLRDFGRGTACGGVLLACATAELVCADVDLDSRCYLDATSSAVGVLGVWRGVEDSPGVSCRAGQWFAR